MSKDPLVYLKHIRDECEFVISVSEKGLSKDQLLNNEILAQEEKLRS